MRLRFFCACAVLAYSTVSQSQEAPPRVPDVSAPQRTAPRIDPQNCRLPAYPANEVVPPGEVPTIQLSMIVDEKGKTSQIQIRRSTGNVSFDSEATKAFSSCLFYPATRDGVAVPSRFSIEYKWSVQ